MTLTKKQLVTDAIAELKASGWCQGETRNRDTGACCAWGAMTDRKGDFTTRAIADRTNLAEAVAADLVELVGWNDSELFPDAPFRVTAWNDAEGRRVEDVIQVFETLAARYDEEVVGD